jgi:replicative DNA helicase
VAKGWPVEYLALSQYLNDKKLIDRIGGQGMLAELLDFVPTPSHYGYYKGILRDKYLLRQIIGACTEGISFAYEYQEDVPGLLNKVALRISEVTKEASGMVSNADNMDGHLDEWMDTWHDIYKGKKESSMPTRWHCWNTQMMGLRPGYTIISGPRGSGKSSLAQNIQTDACLKRGKAGICFNYEMPVRMTINRIIADLGDIEGAYLFAPDLARPPKEVEKKITQCLEKIRASKLEIIHRPSMDMEEVAQRIRACKAKHGSCVALVDYIQLVPPPRLAKDANREQEVAQNSSILRRVSKEVDDTVLGLSQLNRDGTTRESSSIESDADDVYRVERYKQPDGSTSEGGVLVFKNRSGPEGFKLDLLFRGKHYRFEDKDHDNIP